MFAAILISLFVWAPPDSVQFFMPYDRPALMRDGCPIPRFPPVLAFPIWCDVADHTCSFIAANDNKVIEILFETDCVHYIGRGIKIKKVRDFGAIEWKDVPEDSPERSPNEAQEPTTNKGNTDKGNFDEIEL